MVKELRHVDVSNNPALKQLAKEVAESGEGVVLTIDGVELAVMRPVAPRKKTAADLEASESSAGSRPDFDVDGFLKYIYERRDGSLAPGPLPRTDS